jgi:hypothetical protein
MEFQMSKKIQREVEYRIGRGLDEGCTAMPSLEAHVAQTAALSLADTADDVQRAAIEAKDHDDQEELTACVAEIRKCSERLWAVAGRFALRTHPDVDAMRWDRTIGRK